LTSHGKKKEQERDTGPRNASRICAGRGSLLTGASHSVSTFEVKRQPAQALEPKVVTSYPALVGGEANFLSPTGPTRPICSALLPQLRSRTLGQMRHDGGGRTERRLRAGETYNATTRTHGRPGSLGKHPRGCVRCERKRYRIRRQRLPCATRRLRRPGHPLVLPHRPRDPAAVLVCQASRAGTDRIPHQSA